MLVLLSNRSSWTNLLLLCAFSVNINYFHLNSLISFYFTCLEFLHFFLCSFSEVDKQDRLHIWSRWLNLLSTGHSTQHLFYFSKVVLCLVWWFHVFVVQFSSSYSVKDFYGIIVSLRLQHIISYMKCHTLFVHHCSCKDEELGVGCCDPPVGSHRG